MERLHLVPPPAEQLDREVQPHRSPQRLRVCACAAECVRAPAQQATRGAQVADGSEKAPPKMQEVLRQLHQSEAAQPHHPQELQENAAAFACART